MRHIGPGRDHSLSFKEPSVVDTAKVCLVGAGLGDPELLTRRAEKLLSTADAVIYDRLINPQILALVNPEARSIPLGGGSLEERNADVCGWYLRLRETCGSVVRLTSADPLMEGELGEEMEFLSRHGFEIEVIPGVLAETVYECRAAVREARKAGTL
jgi:siroheme synthase